LDRVVFQPLGPAFQEHLQPIGLKRDVAEPGAGRTEGVEVKMTRPGPVAIADAQLVGRLDFPDQPTLVDAELANEVHDRWNGRLPHTDRLRLRGLDQPKLYAHPDQRLRERGRGHPAGRPTPDDRQASDSSVVHVLASGATIT